MNTKVRKVALIAGGIALFLVVAVFWSSVAYRVACTALGGRAEIEQGGWGQTNAYCYSRLKTKDSGKYCCSDDQCGAGECVLSDRSLDMQSTCSIPGDGKAEDPRWFGDDFGFGSTGRCSNAVLLPWQQY